MWIFTQQSNPSSPIEIKLDPISMFVVYENSNGSIVFAQGSLASFTFLMTAVGE